MVLARSGLTTFPPLSPRGGDLSTKLLPCGRGKGENRRTAFMLCRRGGLCTATGPER